MNISRLVFIVVSVQIGKSYAQISGNVVCVQPGLCPGTGGGGIDPRIVTPTDSTPVPTASPITACPPGLIPCATLPKCGTPSVVVNQGRGFVNPGSFPWQVYMTSYNNGFNTYIGSGVILDPNHVLTAAHKLNWTNIRVYVGVYNPQTINTANFYTIQRRCIFPSYNQATLQNDIAMLRLSTPLTLNANVVAACLPAGGTSFANGRCLVAGWGQSNFTLNDAPTTPMKQVYVPIVPYATCLTSFQNATLLGTNATLYLDGATEICAGGNAGEDACTQDGGAPLMCYDGIQYNLAGLVIWGKNCGRPGVYGVYTSVPAFRSWIDSVLYCFNSGIITCNCQ